ncbi:amidohydrolase [Tissierellaceae bacterium HCP3S3_D8]
MNNNEKNYVLQTYDYLHTIPEVGWNEYKTSKFVAEELKKFGYQVIEKVGGKTGVIGILDSGVSGPVFSLRADMDALEFEDENGKYCVHACGHDAHTSMLLAASKEIIKNGIKKGKLYLVFQPAEEVLGGAESIIESGLIDEVEEMAGIHLRPIQEARLGYATPALVHGASYRIIVKIKGLNSHGARPHLGINAVDAAMLLVNAINAIHLDPSTPHSIKVTRVLAGGNTVNLIPDSADIAMDLRAQKNDVMDEMIEKAKQAIYNSVKSIGAEAEIEFIGGVPAAEYNDELVEETRLAIEDVLGQSLDPIITIGGEDFHYYSKFKGIRTAYIGLGCDLEPGLHHPKMHFNKDALNTGAEILEKLVQRKLG